VYLNVTEIESALAALAATYPTRCELITTPHPTHEGRTTAVLRVGLRPAADVDGLLLLGGVHAREWVPPDALVSLAADLLEACDGGTGLGYGGASYTAAQIDRLLQTMNLFIYPCVNPDGRAHSQTTAANWRKNRRPAPPGSAGASCIGVDINRNFDFLWDHLTKFASDSGVSASSNPCDSNVYRGPSPSSEPETSNVVWLLDTYPRIRWHVDVHSAVPVVLYSWGSDEDQSTTPGDSFLNAALDPVRGRGGDVFGEFISSRDLAVATTLAERVRDGVSAVRSSDYPVEQAMTLYPTSGASDDYAFSRHFADPSRTKVHAWTVECGTSFQPAYSEAVDVIGEVSSGLLRMALDAYVVTDGIAVSLRSSSLAFTDVAAGETTARAVVFDCSGDLDLHLEVISGPSGPFFLPIAPPVVVPAPGFGDTQPGRVWVAWTAGPAGTTASGSITVRCRETAEHFVIPIAANATDPPTVGVSMVLDRSGSMAWDAGDGRSRNAVLHEAVRVFMEVLQPSNGIGVVGFDHDASLALPVTVAGPEVFGAGRAAARAALAAHAPNPAGATSIGDGIEVAGGDLDVSGLAFDETAMIVLTDGQENAPKLVADVAAMIDDTVFAVGLGEPAAINPAALTVIANGTGGWVSVSGTLSLDDRFLLAQFFLQILAGVTNEQIVLS
jgi:murein tripeptide amidase MpaA